MHKNVYFRHKNVYYYFVLFLTKFVNFLIIQIKKYWSAGAFMYQLWHTSVAALPLVCCSFAVVIIATAAVADKFIKKTM